ncbi:MAG: hypothetical protein HYX67_07185 [Candidatus Melainabacteria bacterium]|nr:hypothetical protein [Candidatus Melainabacteria bacterium]
MTRDPMDRLQLVFIVVVAIAAIGVAVIVSHIVDSSYEHVKEIKETKIEGTADDISMDIVKNSDNAKTILARTKGSPNELRFSDQTLTRADLKTFVKEPTLTKFKMLRCDFDSADFKVLKDSQVKVVSMSDCPVDKALIDALSEMPKLRTIEMFRCDISKNGLMNLAASKVRLIKFRKCGETRNRIFTRTMFKDLARMPTLVHAELSKNTFEDNAIAGLAGSQLAVLNISRSNATDVDLETLKHLPRLQYVDLQFCAQVTCNGLKLLDQNPSVKAVRTDVVVSSCNLPPSDATKFQPGSYRVPDEWQFEKEPAQ